MTRIECPKCGRVSEGVASFSAHARASHADTAREVQIEGLTEQGGPGECWPWRGVTHARGYAQLAGIRVSRILLNLEKGSGIEARHTCDNPNCVNPGHLIPGTHQQNMDDRQARGRTAQGPRNGKTKLNPQLADEIRRRRADGQSSRAIGAALGLGKTTVNGVRS